jgi:hypothetical protein
LPYIIHSKIDPVTSRDLSCGSFLSFGEKTLIFEKCRIEFGDFSIRSNGEEIISNLSGDFTVQPNGETFETIGLRINFGILRRIPIAVLNISPAVILVFAVILGFHLFKYSGKRGTRLTFIFLVLILVLFIASYKKVYVSQSEIDALKFLFTQPQGKVLVYYKDCLNCSFQTEYKPAAAAGFRKYISKAAAKDIVESLKLPLAKNVEDAKKEIARSNASYVYLLRYEAYLEQLPYPPESLGLVNIYENANAQIFKVVK